MPYMPLIALLAGAASASLYVYGLTLTVASVFVLLLSPLPLWLAGLGWGATAAGLAGAVATMACLVVAEPLIAAMYAAVFAIPAAILVHLAMARRTEDGEEHWFPGRALIGALVAVGLVQVVVAALVLARTEAGLIGTVRDNLVAVFGVYVTEDTGVGSGAVIDQWDSYVLGTMIALVMVAQAGCAALAQGLLAATGRKQRPTPTFWALTVGDWTRFAAVPLVIAIVALAGFGDGVPGGTAEFFEFLLTAFVLVLGVGFLLQGLAVMHALSRGMRAQPFLLAGVYFVALAMQPFGAAFIALIGFFDRWGNFRERFGVAADADMED